VLWSSRAVQTQNEANRYVGSLRRGNEDIVGRQEVLPRLVETKEAIEADASGSCEFLKGPMIGPTLSGFTKRMYNYAVTGSIATATRCLAVQVFMPGAGGESTWVLIRDLGSTVATVPSAVCQHCMSGQLRNSIDIKIENLADNTAPIGTAADINGTHTLDTNADFGSECARETRVTDTTTGGGSDKIIIGLAVNSIEYSIYFKSTGSPAHFSPSRIVSVTENLPTNKPPERPAFTGDKIRCNEEFTGNIGPGWFDQDAGGFTFGSTFVATVNP